MGFDWGDWIWYYDVVCVVVELFDYVVVLCYGWLDYGVELVGEMELVGLECVY